MLNAPLLSLALAAATPIHAMTVEDLLAFDRVGEPALSPDGTQVAFTVSRARADGAGLTAAVWLVPATGGEPKPLAPGWERSSGARFSPDGRRLAVVATRPGQRPGLLIVPLEGGEPVAAPDIPGGPAGHRWTPDGKALLVLAEVDPACGADLACNQKADEVAAGTPYATDRLLFRHWDAWRTRTRVHLLRVPLDGGPVSDLTPGDRDVPPAHRGSIDDVAVSPDGATVYLAAMADAVEAISTNADLYAIPMAGGPARPLTTAPGWDGSPRPSPDGQRLAWLRQPRAGYEADRRHVMVATRDGRDERDLTATLDRTADTLWWVDGGRALRFTTTVAGLAELWEVAVAGGSPRRLVGGLSHLAAVSPSADGRALAVLADSLLAPGEVALLSGDPAPALRRLTRFGAPLLDALEPVGYRPFTARGRDGATVHGWLMTPPGHQRGQRHPAVVMIHGGPQGAWDDAWSFRWNPRLWASRGYTVILPNPRGSTGFGQGYTDAVRNDWGGAPYQDIMALTDAAIASGEADEARMCAAGASYGGYMVNWINGQTDRFKCLVTHAGNFDLEAAYYDTEELWFPEWELGRPFESPGAFTRWSPSRFVARWKTPTLVTHGELDYRVAVTQGMSAFTALQRRGVESRLVVFPDENHWILKPRNSRRFHQEVFGWIDRHLALPSPPATPR
jgi:dipeptidyl aminopeptidase/acylaminoacyl peptidase